MIAPTSPVSSKANSARQTTAVLPPEGASHKTPESTPKKTQALSNIGTDQMSLGDGESIEVCPECQKVFKRKVTVYFCSHDVDLHDLLFFGGYYKIWHNRVQILTVSQQKPIKREKIHPQ